MVRAIRKNEIRAFIAFGDSIYKKDSNYVPYLHRDLAKSLRVLAFEKRKYEALCSFDATGHINARILLTVGPNKQLNTEQCGYFSHFECVNDQNVFNELMDAACAWAKEHGCSHLLGEFFRHDPDNRRGILVQGQQLSPMIFTSHHPTYYQTLFEAQGSGFVKLTDALEYEYAEKPGIVQKIAETAARALIENDIHIDKINPHGIDRDIEDVHTIMEIASTKINFEHVLSKEAIKKIFVSWRHFISADYVFIARRNSDNAPVGFTLSIPDYFEVIRKMHGKTDLRGLFVFLITRKRIRGLRAVLQYIIPEYQHKGVSKALYWETAKSVQKNGVTRISLGTIMEENVNSNGAILSLGGELSRIYRIYYRTI